MNRIRKKNYFEKKYITKKNLNLQLVSNKINEAMYCHLGTVFVMLSKKSMQCI